MKKPVHKHLRLGILSTDPAHIVAPALLIMHIRHFAKLSKFSPVKTAQLKALKLPGDSVPDSNDILTTY